VRAQAGISGQGPTNVTGQTGIYADVVRWVEESYNEIQTIHENWNFLHNNYTLPIPAYVQEITMPVDGVRVIAKETFIHQESSGDKERVRYVPYSVWKLQDRFTLDEVKTEVPTYVTQLPNNNLRFNSKLDDLSDVLFEGYREPHIMVNSTDTPIFPPQYHDLIQFKALIKYASYYNATEVYKANEAAFREGISKMKFSELPKENLYTPPLVVFA